MSALNTVSLTDYLTYLRDTKHRSAQTLDLYSRSAQACGLDVINQEDVPTIWTQLRKQFDSNQVGRIYIEKCKTLIRGAMKRKAWKFEPTEDYQYLLEQFNTSENDVLEYTDEEVRLLLAVTYSDTDLFNSCVLQVVSGLRVGAIEGLKWTDFHQVPDAPDVMIYKVLSKGRFYTPAISTRVFKFLQARNGLNNPYLVWFDEGFKGTFSRRMYAKLRYVVRIKYQLDEQLDLGNKSLQHSMRHYFATQASSVLDEQDLAVLTGHKAYQGTLSKYVNKRIKKVGALPLPEYQKKIAELYKKTPLFNFPIEDVEADAKIWRRV
jgi:integrase